VAAALDLAAALVRIARTIEGAEQLDDMLETISSAACALVPGFEHSGISAFDDGGGLSTLAASDDLVRDLDSLQARLGEGPSITALRDSDVVSAPQLRTDRRWPKYAHEAATTQGVQSQLAIPLTVEDQVVGVLALCSTGHSEVDPDAGTLAEVFAGQAAVAIGHAREVEQLQRALGSSRTIGTAIGIVMARDGVDRAGAFRSLAQTSQDSNVRLRDLAAEIVFRAETG
jgi:GAF domain-containing protein